MNENLNLCKILKDCPKGTKLWSSVWGDVIFDKIYEGICCKPIALTAVGCNDIALYSNGKMYNIEESECILFPSKSQRDWSKFKAPVKRFNPKEFKPFDKVLVCDSDESEWIPNFFGKLVKFNGYLAYDIINKGFWKMCIPYNDETKHLLGTTDDCPEYYKWWEE